MRWRTHAVTGNQHVRTVALFWSLHDCDQNLRSDYRVVVWSLGGD